MANTEQIFSKLCDCMTEFKINEIGKVVQEAIDAGIPALEVITKGMSRGMEIIGEQYENQHVFLSDLIMAGETMKEGIKVLEPYLEQNPGKKVGVVVIGTVQGDLHDIGKNIVKSVLIGKGFGIYNLGVDVSPEEFVDTLRKTRVDILGLSALLTTTIPQIKATLDAIKRAGSRDKLKIILGGAALAEEDARELGVDAYAQDAVLGAKTCEKWVKT